MNAREKKKFINDLVKSVRFTLVESVPNMPEEWTGHELRQLIADKFNAVNYLPMGRADKKAYRNACLVRNL